MYPLPPLSNRSRRSGGKIHQPGGGNQEFLRQSPLHKITGGGAGRTPLRPSNCHRRQKLRDQKLLEQKLLEQKLRDQSVALGQSEQFRSTAARLVSLREISLVRLACHHQVADCD